MATVQFGVRVAVDCTAPVTARGPATIKGTSVRTVSDSRQRIAERALQVFKGSAQ